MGRDCKASSNFIWKKYKDIDWEMLEFTKQDFDYMFPNWKVDFASLNQDLSQYIAKKEGKIWVAFDEYAWDTIWKTYQIFEWEVPVYTKQQLKQIREEANKTKWVKLPTKIKSPKAMKERITMPRDMVKVPESETLYHWWLSKIDKFDIWFARTSNYGKWIYF